MLFNSPEFILAFLPITLLLYYGLGRALSPRAAIGALILCSAFYYAWWRASYLAIVALSILGNYLLGRLLSSPGLPPSRRKPILWLGVAGNLGALGYYKYASFVEDNLFWLLGREPSLGPIVLPLAISFFTFQQISYLADAYEGSTREHSFLRYCLFVLFFPQLIAGPIVHHAEMLPQFGRPSLFAIRIRRFAVGLSIFAIGLFKKVVIADNVARYSTPVFETALSGTAIGALDAWTGALAYTFQLYYDFSGYSDMAIGLGFLFGIRLPVNFLSPYKSLNVIDFWRRWHVTLSRFLRDYLYIPLGGNRRGRSRRYVNLMITMVLGGLWHGAGWNFLIWGSLHGIYLVINHVWRFLRPEWIVRVPVVGRALSWSVTFLAVVVGWVFFRAESFDSAVIVLRGMAGLQPSSPDTLVFDPLVGATLAILLVFTLASANTFEYFRLERPSLAPRHLQDADADDLPPWRPTPSWACGVGVLAALALLSLERVSEFLYFQF